MDTFLRWLYSCLKENEETISVERQTDSFCLIIAIRTLSLSPNVLEHATSKSSYKVCPLNVTNECNHRHIDLAGFPL